MCVCDPATAGQGHCTYEQAPPAEGLLRLFIQETMMALLLLGNYLAIALDHELRQQTYLRVRGKMIGRPCAQHYV